MSIRAWETAFYFAHERMFMRKCLSFLNRTYLKPNSRIHANCSTFYPSTAEVGIQHKK